MSKTIKEPDHVASDIYNKVFKPERCLSVEQANKEFEKEGGANDSLTNERLDSLLHAGLIEKCPGGYRATKMEVPIKGGV